jgi:hypothetical protein
MLLEQVKCEQLSEDPSQAVTVAPNSAQVAYGSQVLKGMPKKSSQSKQSKKPSRKFK